MEDQVKVCSWNMQHNPAAWARLAEMRDEHGVQIALLQEAVPPPAGEWLTHPQATASEEWVITAHADVRREFASAVVVLDQDMDLEPVIPQPLGTAEYGKFAVSHPGQFAVANVRRGSGPPLTVISLYGIWEQDDRYLFSEATLHRAISDLTTLLQQDDRASMVMAGDLNIFHEWDRADYDAYWAPRYDTVFTRLAAYGLELAGPFGEQPLEGCHCGRGEGCRHARTFAYHRDPLNRPNQLDYVFATASAGVESVRVLNDKAAWQYSDHLPVITTLVLPQRGPDKR